jgi:hypothetical protein
LPIPIAFERWRQIDEPPSLQFEQQTPGGHVFKLTRVVAPVPKLAEMKGKRRAMPVRVLCN